MAGLKCDPCKQEITLRMQLYPVLVIGWLLHVCAGCKAAFQKENARKAQSWGKK
jgi:hypothetical protein